MTKLVTPAVWDADLSCGVPVFRPTAEEFADFEAYVTSIEPLCGAGLAKVIPPEGWKARRDGYPPSLLHHVKIKQPIEQQFSKHSSQAGAFFQHNVIQATRSQWSFRNEAIKTSFRPSVTLRRQLEAVPGGAAVDPPAPAGWAPSKKLDAIAAAEAAIAPVDLAAAVPLCPLQRPAESRADFEQRRQAFLAELELQYWGNLTVSQPKYGADMAGTLFDPDLATWNLNRLPNLLGRLPRRLPGVCIPYLYFGMWRATFSWHVEDMDLYSINYLHYGAPKQWYVVPPTYRKALEVLAGDIFRDEARMCSQFMRHKTQLIAPAVLAHHGIPLHRVIQEAGQFVITFPAAYHAGFNHGFNCAEAINFALPQWIPTGRRAHTCHCTPDAVWINMDLFDPPPVVASVPTSTAPNGCDASMTAPNGDDTRTIAGNGDAIPATAPNGDNTPTTADTRPSPVADSHASAVVDAVPGPHEDLHARARPADWLSLLATTAASSGAVAVRIVGLDAKPSAEAEVVTTSVALHPAPTMPARPEEKTGWVVEPVFHAAALAPLDAGVPASARPVAGGPRMAPSSPGKRAHPASWESPERLGHPDDDDTFVPRSDDLPSSPLLSSSSAADEADDAADLVKRPRMHAANETTV